MDTHPGTTERAQVFKSSEPSGLRWEPSDDTRRTIEDLKRSLGGERVCQIIKSMLDEASKELTTIISEIALYAEVDNV